MDWYGLVSVGMGLNGLVLVGMGWYGLERVGMGWYGFGMGWAMEIATFCM